MDTTRGTSTHSAECHRPCNEHEQTKIIAKLGRFDFATDHGDVGKCMEMYKNVGNLWSGLCLSIHNLPTC